MSEDRTAGAVLCGGRSSRFGEHKAHALLNGVTLVERVIARLGSQVDSVWLNVQQGTADLEALGLELLEDAVQGHRGPLTGLYTALRHAGRRGVNWLVLCPCDAPFLPADLVEVLREAAEETEQSVVTVRYDDVVQPTFSLWHASMLDVVETQVLAEDGGGLMRLLDDIDHAVVDWPEAGLPPFFNVNTPADLAQAKALLDAAEGGD